MKGITRVRVTGYVIDSEKVDGYPRGWFKVYVDNGRVINVHRDHMEFIGE